MNIPPKAAALEAALAADGFTQPGHEIAAWKELAIKFEAAIIEHRETLDVTCEGPVDTKLWRILDP